MLVLKFSLFPFLPSESRPKCVEQCDDSLGSPVTTDHCVDLTVHKVSTRLLKFKKCRLPNFKKFFSSAFSCHLPFTH